MNQNKDEIRNLSTLCTLDDLEGKWEEVVSTMSDNKFYDHKIFNSVERTSLTDKELVLHLKNGSKSFLNKEDVDVDRLRDSLAKVIDIPARMTLTLEYVKNPDSDKNIRKLRRHLQSKG